MCNIVSNQIKNMTMSKNLYIYIYIYKKGNRELRKYKKIHSHFHTRVPLYKKNASIIKNITIFVTICHATSCE